MIALEVYSLTMSVALWVPVAVESLPSTSSYTALKNSLKLVCAFFTESRGCMLKCDTKQCNAMQCNAMQCNAMQCNAMQCNAMQCNAMQCNAIQCNAIQYCSTPDHVEYLHCRLYMHCSLPCKRRHQGKL